MKKKIKKIKKDIIQITTSDERWYHKTLTEENSKTNLPETKDVFVPSVTWITQFYPKGIAYFKWLADKGWNEAETIKVEAGDRGSRVHKAIEDLINKKIVKIDSIYIDSEGKEKELTVDEYECIISFADWFNLVKPKILACETTIFNDEYNYAGTIDLICEIEKEIYIIDFKTSQYIWPSHKIQLSAYKHATKYKNAKLAILQVGYKRNKRMYKFTEIEDDFNLFLAAKEIWFNETKNIKPLQKDYPIKVKLDFNKLK